MKNALTRKTRVIIINSPNPTGAVYDRSELKKIASLVCEHDAWIVSDEIYASLVYGNVEHFSVASLDK